MPCSSCSSPRSDASSEMYYSDMSTISSSPNKRGAAGMQNPRLKEDIEEKYSSDVNLIQFITNVWGVKPELAGHILSKSWSLPPGPLETYKSARHEKDMYAPFAEMADSLVKEATKAAKEFSKPSDQNLPEKNSIFFCNAKGDKPLSSDLATKRKPDMLTVDKIFAGEKPLWSLVGQIIELKRRFYGSECADTLAFPGFIETSSATASSSNFRIPEVPSSAARQHPARGSQSQSIRATATAGVGDHGQSCTASSQKRKYSESQDATCVKRRRVSPKLTVAHLQLATYALECLAASTRHYISALWIDRFQVSLWYFDRACIIQTETFNFDEEPEKLVLVLYALGACDDKHAGFDPNLVQTSSATRPERPLGCPRHWQDVIGSEIKFPIPKGSSSVTPKLRIEETVFAYRGLIGRGTMVYKVAGMNEPSVPRALKISWPVPNRKLEAETIKRLRERLPNWRDHLPEVDLSANMTAEELELPRVELLKQRPIEGFEDRWLHALLMRFYGKLWEVGSVKAFQDVFVDCVECHYHAYVDGKVLHRDLSENNLMFKHTDDTNDGNVKGILNDWDMASYVEHNNEILPSTAKLRTGTIRFMAVELMVDGTPPAHLYRHDLESFFYILIWAALHYDFENKRRLGKVAIPVVLWDADLLENAMGNKFALLTFPEKMNKLREHVLPGCQALLPWINALWTLFMKAHIDYVANFNNPKWDNKTRGGWITFEKFMEALGRTPRHFTSPTRSPN